VREDDYLSAVLSDSGPLFLPPDSKDLTWLLVVIA
jgi:hypothetical protein